MWACQEMNMRGATSILPPFVFYMQLPIGSLSSASGSLTFIFTFSLTQFITVITAEILLSITV